MNNIGQFLLENWISLIFGLISIAIVAYCKFLHKKFKEYKVILDQQQKEEFEKLIDAKLKEVNEKLKLYETFFETIKHSYRFRLISLCERYLERGYLTPKEYSQLNEMWGVYHGLKGNDQGDDYYHKAEKLPIHEHREGDKGNK